jgi:uncharacterized protein (TIGR02996 family)
MTDRDALLRAIIESPADDAPRLVYADWLDEHGDPVRAEFIRLQCEQSQIVLGTQAAFGRFTTIQIRCWALFAGHRDRWLRELGRLPPDSRLQIWFRRGMAAKVFCPVEYFLAYGDRLFIVAPVEELEFHELRSEHVRSLAGCPWSRRVRRFRLVRADGWGRLVDSLLANWPFPGLEAWELRVGTTDETSDEWHDRWSRVAVAIARSSCLQALRRLRLAGCGIGDAGGRALADSPHLDGLDVLDLTDNPMSPTVRYQLLDRFGWRVIFDYRDCAGFRVGELFW